MDDLGLISHTKFAIANTKSLEYLYNLHLSKSSDFQADKIILIYLELKRRFYSGDESFSIYKLIGNNERLNNNSYYHSSPPKLKEIKEVVNRFKMDLLNTEISSSHEINLKFLDDFFILAASFVEDNKDSLLLDFSNAGKLVELLRKKSVGFPKDSMHLQEVNNLISKINECERKKVLLAEQSTNSSKTISIPTKEIKQKKIAKSKLRKSDAINILKGLDKFPEEERYDLIEYISTKFSIDVEYIPKKTFWEFLLSRPENNITSKIAFIFMNFFEVLSIYDDENFLDFVKELYLEMDNTTEWGYELFELSLFYKYSGHRFFSSSNASGIVFAKLKSNSVKYMMENGIDKIVAHLKENAGKSISELSTTVIDITEFSALLLGSIGSMYYKPKLLSFEKGGAVIEKKLSSTPRKMNLLSAFKSVLSILKTLDIINQNVDSVFFSNVSLSTNSSSGITCVDELISVSNNFISGLIVNREDVDFFISESAKTKRDLRFALDDNDTLDGMFYGLNLFFIRRFDMPPEQGIIFVRHDFLSVYKSHLRNTPGNIQKISDLLTILFLQCEELIDFSNMNHLKAFFGIEFSTSTSKINIHRYKELDESLLSLEVKKLEKENKPVYDFLIEFALSEADYEKILNILFE